MIIRWGAAVSSGAMEDEILVDLAPKIRTHPWWQARAKLAVALLESNGVRPPSRVLDAGCGWGVNLEALEAHGYSVAGLDVSRATLERLDRPDRRLIAASLTDAPPPDAERFDAVLALDVLEHLDEDRVALSHAAQLARPGGLIMVSVPALPALYSEFDEVQGHRRRYDEATFRALFDDVGLRLDRLIWWGGWMIPLIRLRKAMKSRRGGTPMEVYERYLGLPPAPFRQLMDAAYRRDHGRVLAGKTRRGTSLIGLARTPA
jgi:SAM-dependent methyltransferase